MKGIKLNKRAQGFTLIELMIVVAIIGILAAIALPAYQDYTKKSKFAEVTTAVGAARTQVAICYQELGTLTGCTSGSNGLTAAVTAGTGHLASLSVTNGTITAQSSTETDSTTLTATPSVTNADGDAIPMEWTVTGGCITNGWCKDY